jgi:hypothetical protein
MSVGSLNAVLYRNLSVTANVCMLFAFLALGRDDLQRSERQIPPKTQVCDIGKCICSVVRRTRRPRKVGIRELDSAVTWN